MYNIIKEFQPLIVELNKKTDKKFLEDILLHL